MDKPVKQVKTFLTSEALIYMYATEIVSEYYEGVSVSGEDVLTVCDLRMY